MDPKLENLLNDAISNEKERWKILAIAGDYSRDNLDDPFLEYVFRWMIRHKKFPRVKQSIITAKRKVPKKLIENSTKEFYANLAKNPPRSSKNIPEMLKSYLRSITNQYFKTTPKEEGITQNKLTFSWTEEYEDYWDLPLELRKEAPDYAISEDYGHYKSEFYVLSWKELIEFFKTFLKKGYQWYQI